MAAQVILHEDGGLSLKGSITIDNVVPVVAHGIALFDRHDLVIDLAEVSDVDSSAASMLLEWQREAGRRNLRVCFANMPEKLQSLVRLYGLSELIHFA